MLDSIKAGHAVRGKLEHKQQMNFCAVPYSLRIRKVNKWKAPALYLRNLAKELNMYIVFKENL